MGQDASKIDIGPKSSRSEVIILGCEDIDYKDVKNINNAKKELYELFLEDKLVHISRLEETEDKLERLTKESEHLHKALNNYRKLNNSSNNKELNQDTVPPLKSACKDYKEDESYQRINRIANKIKEAKHRLKSNKKNQSDNSDTE